MPNWVHRTTKQLLTSTSPASLLEPEGNYIQEPDLSALAGVPSRYWNISGDLITEMSAAEKAVVDTAMLEAGRDGLNTQYDDLESDLRQVVRLIISELNILRAQHGLPARTFGQFKNQIRNGYGS